MMVSAPPFIMFSFVVIQPFDASIATGSANGPVADD
jgi:hypothetical protein